VDEQQIQNLKVKFKHELQTRGINSKNFFETFKHDGQGDTLDKVRFIHTIIDDLKLPFQDTDLNHIFDYLDQDRDGLLNLREFLKIIDFDQKVFQREKSKRENDISKVMTSQ